MLILELFATCTGLVYLLGTHGEDGTSWSRMVFSGHMFGGLGWYLGATHP